MYVSNFPTATTAIRYMMKRSRSAMRWLFDFARRQYLAGRRLFSTGEISRDDKKAAHGQQDEQQSDIAPSESEDGLILDQRAVRSIKQGLVQMRELETTRAQRSLDLEALELAWDLICQKMTEAEDYLKDIQVSSRTAPASVTSRLELLVEAVQSKKSEIETRIEETERTIKQAEARLLKKKATLALAMDDFFVDKDVLEENDTSEPKLSPAVADLAKFLEEQDAVHQWEELKPQVSRYNPPGSTVSSTTYRRKKMQESYRHMTAILRLCQNDFDSREEQFEQKRTERQEALDNGASAASSTSLARHEFLETQRLTRCLIGFERDVQSIKDKAIAAGFDLADSEQESGFVDDVKDGYRLSQEEEEVRLSTNFKRIQVWIEQVPEQMSEPDTVPEVDVDEWECRPMELWDSVSMVAEGPERRRIDKWRRIAMASVNDDVQRLRKGDD